MDKEIIEKVELYILTNYNDYSKETLINELTKSGFSHEDASKLYSATLKKLLKPSQKMHYAKTNKLPFMLVGILVTIIIIVFFIFR